MPTASRSGSGKKIARKAVKVTNVGRSQTGASLRPKVRPPRPRRANTTQDEPQQPQAGGALPRLGTPPIDQQFNMDDDWEGMPHEPSQSEPSSGPDAEPRQSSREKVDVVDLAKSWRPRARQAIQRREEEDKAFSAWSAKFDTLVPPFLAATRDKLPAASSWGDLACPCRRRQAEGLATSARARTLRVLDSDALLTVKLDSCDEHVRSTLIRAGIFPAAPARPAIAFTFTLLRFFRALQSQTRLGSSHFVNALLRLYQEGTSKMSPRPANPSKNRYRKQFKTAFAWFNALENRSKELVLEGPLPKFHRPQLQADTLSLRITDLVERCPACFGNMLNTNAEPDTSPSSHPDVLPPTQTPPRMLKPEVIVCIDGNFQHKRWREDDTVLRSQLPPSLFLSSDQVQKACEEFTAASSQAGPTTGCGAYVKAAVEGEQKGSLGPFDIGGVMGLTCRHGTPLVMANVVDTGEGHHYAYALICALLDACGTRLTHLGVCYDIGCKLAVSPRMTASLANRYTDKTLTYAVSLFHVYGHDTDCQIKFSPRRCDGFAWTDGESLERLWSSLRDLVSITRPMSRVSRQQTLVARLDKLAGDARLDLLKTLKGRMESTGKLLVKEIAAVAKMAGEVRGALLALDLERVMNEAEAAQQESTSTESGGAEGMDEDTQDTAGITARKPLDRLMDFGTILPPELQNLNLPIYALVDSRRSIAFHRPAAQRKAQQRLDRLLHLPALAAEEELARSKGIDVARDDVPGLSESDRAKRARERALLGPGNMLKYIATREKVACEALSAAALALHKPLVQWHSITDQMASRNALPSNHILVRQTISKAGSTKQARSALVGLNKLVAQHNLIASDCASLRATMLARRPAVVGPSDQSFAALAAQPDSPADFHYATPSLPRSRQALTGTAHQEYFLELAKRPPILAASKVLDKDLFDRDLLSRLAAMINPTDLQFQPWAMSPTLASAMDHFERIHRLAEEVERIVSEAADAVNWICCADNTLSARKRLETDGDRLALLDRHKQTLHSLLRLRSILPKPAPADVSNKDDLTAARVEAAPRHQSVADRATIAREEDEEELDASGSDSTSDESDHDTDSDARSEAAGDDPLDAVRLFDDLTLALSAVGSNEAVAGRGQDGGGITSSVSAGALAFGEVGGEEPPGDARPVVERRAGGTGEMIAGQVMVMDSGISRAPGQVGKTQRPTTADGVTAGLVETARRQEMFADTTAREAETARRRAAILHPVGSYSFYGGASRRFL
ncbi:hypothetical protein V8E36_005023 [Tilletia maclaganii]